jgi:hypothetical protein
VIHFPDSMAGHTATPPANVQVQHHTGHTYQVRQTQCRHTLPLVLKFRVAIFRQTASPQPPGQNLCVARCNLQFQFIFMTHTLCHLVGCSSLAACSVIIWVLLIQLRTSSRITDDWLGNSSQWWWGICNTHAVCTWLADCHSMGACNVATLELDLHTQRTQCAMTDSDKLSGCTLRLNKHCSPCVPCKLSKSSVPPLCAGHAW